MGQFAGVPVSPDTRLASVPAELALQNWSWRYLGRSDWTLRDVSFTINPGERVLLLGASGSGKTSVLKALAGLLSEAEGGESSGVVSVDKQPVGSAPHRVGMVLQDPDSQVMLSRVGDDVAFGCENLGVPVAEIPGRVQAALSAVSLNLDLGHPTEQLSGGQKQRLALAGVLAMRPGAILLDEPTALLDPDGVLEVRRAVETVCAQRSSTVVIVEHRVDLWLDLVDRVIVLGAGGSVVADGAPHTVLTEQAELLGDLGVWLPGADVKPSLVGAASSSRPALTAEEVCVGWNADSPVARVDQISLIPGSVLAITGSNGAGKTALALTLGGLLAPQGGQVDAHAIAGDLDPDPNSWKSVELVERIASVFQIPEHQFVAPTVRDELALSLRKTRRQVPENLEHGELQVSDRIDHIAHRLGLTRLLPANPFTLSGGEQRRLSVATAMIAAPPVLILDEPTFGQDAKTWAELVSLIVELRDQNTAIAIVTHDQKLIEAVADREIRLTQLSPSTGSVPFTSPHLVSGGDVSDGEATQPHTQRPAPKPARITTVNPLAKIAAAAIISLSLIFSLDWVSATVALVLEFALIFWAGLAPKRLLRTVAPLLIAATLTALTIALYGQQSGTTYLQFLLINVSDGSLELALATFLRVLAIALPAVVLLATVDPTDLADSLEQHTRWSPRFIFGALVAFRLLTLIAADWRMLTRARRARGLGDASALSKFARQTFALLVLSMRRADKLSTAMQARGFGGSQPRTWSRTSTFGRAEWMLVALGIAIALTAITVSVATGSWNLVFGGLS